MSGRLDAMPPRDAASAVAAVLRDGGHVAYFAGGCVRDRLLGLEPGDYDIATDATPPQVCARLRGARLVGEAFGVVLVHLGGRTIEVATFRSDGPYHDGRRPSAVTLSDARGDAQRRDFTINGLFEDPVSGEIIDYVDGRADLAARVVRAIGDPAARLAEDRLRTVRAVRFAARLGFDIAPATASAVRDAAPGLGAVSRERIGQELRKMLAHPSRADACEWLERLHLDGPTLLEPHAEPPPRGSRTSVAALAAGAPWVLALAAWRRGRRLREGGAGAGDARGALVLSNEESVQLAHIERIVAALPTWPGTPLAARIRAAAHPQFLDALALAAAEGAEHAGCWRDEYERLSTRPGGLSPAPLLGGDDLIARGLRPGPRFKSILDAAYDAQLEAPILHREVALAALDGLIAGSGKGSP